MGTLAEVLTFAATNIVVPLTLQRAVTNPEHQHRFCGRRAERNSHMNDVHAVR